MPNRFFRYILGVSQGFELFALVEPLSTDTLNVDLASLFVSLVLRASFAKGPRRPTKPSADELVYAEAYTMVGALKSLVD